MDYTRINFSDKSSVNTGKPRISGANLTKMEDGIVEGITKAEAALARIGDAALASGSDATPYPTTQGIIASLSVGQAGIAATYEVRAHMLYQADSLGADALFAGVTRDGGIAIGEGVRERTYFGDAHGYEYGAWSNTYLVTRTGVVVFELQGYNRKPTKPFAPRGPQTLFVRRVS